MKIIITGKSSQLSQQLMLTKPSGYDCISLDSKELDITKKNNIYEVFEQLSPDLVINPAAYTAVDNAEDDESEAFRVNTLGALYLANACKDFSAKLIHISTDYVFDGRTDHPVTPNSKTNPLNVYGKSKLKGESSIFKVLPSTAISVRTSWLYSQFSQNFVKTMLTLMAERDEINVVNDQIGCPTWAHGLAEVLWKLAEQLFEDSSFIDTHGQVFHWSDSGEITWYEFALAIKQLATEKGLNKAKANIYPTTSDKLNFRAVRPSYSVLDCSKTSSILGVKSRNWYEQLGLMLDSLS